MKYGLSYPYMALDGKEDGLYFYRRITEECRKYLKPGGWLVYEIGWDQGQAVTGIMENAGFEQVTVKKDLAGLTGWFWDRIPEQKFLPKNKVTGGTECLINWRIF